MLKEIYTNYKWLKLLWQEPQKIKYQHITSVLHLLDWQTIKFKIGALCTDAAL